jgi:formamidopyrimidine-DNA glycosylase
VPELPEVETIRRGVAAEFAGRRITAVAATGARTLRRHADPVGFATRVAGHRLVGVGRRGKYLLLHLDGGDMVVVHMGMSGQLLMTPADAPTGRHTHVVLAFGTGPQLRFVDPRTFGEVFVTTAADERREPPELDHLGVEALGDDGAGPGRARLAAVLGPRRVRLKPLLLDQHAVAGIGNMYADEILWHARLRHDRVASELGRAEIGRLGAAMTAVLGAAIAHRGSSLADEQYRDIYGRTGDYQHLHRVYDRAGQPCARCGRPIERVTAYGRSTYFCPRCQPRRRTAAASTGVPAAPGARR